MTITVSEALDLDTCLKLTVERTDPGAYVDGLYVQGAVSTFKSLISPQQPTPKELQVLSEGERDKDIMMFISKRKLRTDDDGNNIVADVILYDNSKYRVIKLADWSSFGHTIAFGAKE